MLVVIEHRLSPIVRYEKQALLKALLLNGPSALALAFERELVDLFAADSVERRDQVGADALWDLKDLLAELQIVTVEHAFIGSHGHARHALDAAGDDQVLLAAHHAHRSEIEGLEARA